MSEDESIWCERQDCVSPVRLPANVRQLPDYPDIVLIRPGRKAELTRRLVSFKEVEPKCGSVSAKLMPPLSPAPADALTYEVNTTQGWLLAAMPQISEFGGSQGVLEVVWFDDVSAARQWLQSRLEEYHSLWSFWACEPRQSVTVRYLVWDLEIMKITEFNEWDGLDHSVVSGGE